MSCLDLSWIHGSKWPILSAKVVEEIHVCTFSKLRVMPYIPRSWYMPCDIYDHWCVPLLGMHQWSAWVKVTPRNDSSRYSELSRFARGSSVPRKRTRIRPRNRLLTLDCFSSYRRSDLDLEINKNTLSYSHSLYCDQVDVTLNSKEDPSLFRSPAALQYYIYWRDQ